MRHVIKSLLLAVAVCFIAPERADADQYAAHLNYGPLRLLTLKNAIVAKLGVGSPGKLCEGHCFQLLKYTDGTDLLVLTFGDQADLISITIKRAVNAAGIARVKPSIPAIREWRWEGLLVLAMPPAQIKGWPVCDGGWIERGYCGGGEKPRGLVVTYSIRHHVVTEVSFGTE